MINYLLLNFFFFFDSSSFVIDITVGYISTYISLNKAIILYI